MNEIETYKVYKIRRKSDGLFSGGGSSPSFGKTGKEWYSMAAVASHLGLSGHMDIRGGTYGSWRETPLEEVEIVTYEYEVHKKELNTLQLDQYYAGLNERRKKRQAQEERANAKRHLERAEREFQEASQRLAKLKGNNGL